MFIDFFIRRPVFAIVCSILLTLVGLIAIPTLPVAQYPDLAPPQVTVSATYVGASAEVVESAVTIPLEQELNGVEGMRYISSTSGNDGTSNVTITFEATRDIEVAAVDVQNRVSRAAARLPAQVNQTGIVVNKASSQILLSVALYSPDDRYDAKFLSNYADVNLKDAIKRVRGVGDVRIFGERKFSMRVWLDPTELARRKLTPLDVTRALQEQNLQVAAGQVGQPPSEEDQPYQLAVRARGRLIEPEEFGDIVLMRDESGRAVRMKDVARVELGAENYGTLLRFSGKQAVGIATFQLPTANALEVRDAVLAELQRLSAQFPPGMEYQTGTDTTLAVRATLREVVRTLVEAIVLVVLVIFLFLHGWRSVLITALTLPVSLVGTFAFVKLLDFSINTLTLFGLTLATGLVVDDAIVVIENIERLMLERKLTAAEAAREGMKEVSGAVIAISIVLVAVFLPVALFPGTTGAIYRQFALTIAASVALSTFCALTLTPALAARMLSHHTGDKWVFFRQVDRVLDQTRLLYGRGLRRLLAHPALVLGAFLLCVVATAALVVVTPTGFIPDEDQGYLLVTVQGPEGTSLSQTQKVMAEVEQVLLAQPEVRALFANGGMSPQGTGSNLANIFVPLKPWDERTGEDQSVAALVERLRAPLSRIGGARVVPFQPPAIRGVGAVGGFQFVVEDTAGVSSLDQLASAAQQLMAQGNDDGRLRGVFTGFNADTPLLDVEVDRQLAKAVGVPIDQIFSTLQAYMGSQYINDFNYANRAYRVYVQAEQQFRDSPADIAAFYVRSDTGDMIPLESLVKVQPTISAQLIRHHNLFRAVELSGQAAPGVSSGQAMEAMEELAARHLPQGMSAEWTGISLEQKESGGQSLLIFGLGLLFVFLVLAAQYESFSLPLVIILSVPLAILGALGLQLLRGQANDVFCQLGLVMLVGLASKNAILIVEFAEQLRAQGRSITDAVVEAAEVRLRPILMTSTAFLLGVVPMMTASGAGAGSRNSLGTAVFGGMLVSTVVNLVFIPGLYVLVQKLRGEARLPAPDARVVATPSH
ncbi:multidrug efflux RND transporter permease subunit [Myxococcus sp. XM-1-1-1]|uniref:efflux RND transporter permease subunit n=1 Tax=Myxococcus sp. XM-1-1-1 TaxID=2874602 RepID=UPI001CBB611A|nr:multidrug efflux RND transporter permease subunit [Myxococcus sp. XM-1-1-1]MBZ4409765.1 multidrug efflux RND transporter permease subunit [Myxococcus sp. XM-1-1-1]